MKTGTTIFLLFFGVAMLDAFRNHDWIAAIFWVAIGLVFLRADFSKQSAELSDPRR